MLNPRDHRLVDGGHTLVGAWNAVRDALPDDTFYQEMAGYFSALASDISSKAGLPLITLSPDSLDNLTTSLSGALGISESWVLDALTVNGQELLGTTTAVIAAALNWSETDTDRFSKVSGSLGLSAIATANPLLAIVTTVMLAKAFHDAKSKDQYAEAAIGMSKGGVVTGVVMAVGSLVGGPGWIGLMVALCAGVITSKVLSPASGTNVTDLSKQISKFLITQLKNPIWSLPVEHYRVRDGRNASSSEYQNVEATRTLPESELPSAPAMQHMYDEDHGDENPRSQPHDTQNENSFVHPGFVNRPCDKTPKVSRARMSP